MKTKDLDKIIILDFGSQTTQLIARRIRNAGIFVKILPSSVSIKKIKSTNPKGIILSGGPESLSDPKAPRAPEFIFELGIPILGICYGLQLITEYFKGKVVKGKNRKEYGKAELIKIKDHTLTQGFFKKTKKNVWMSHGDEVAKAPKDFTVLAKTEHSPLAVLANDKKKIYAVQFHPEVSHTQNGKKILLNFAEKICKAKKKWEPQMIIENLIKETRQIAKNKKVIHAISGGVDSTVMAEILRLAVGDKLKCVLIDTGLMRKNEVRNIKKRFKKHLKTKVTVINASENFLRILKDVESGEKRRKLIGKEYIKIFKKMIGKNDFLSQGTLYPDVIESSTVDSCQHSHTIKTHHNRAKEVVELMNQGRVIEIFKDLFKDEVRKIGQSLGLPKEIVQRQPFPGPGLAIRILGKITPEKLEILRQADAITIEELKKAGLYYKISQAIVALDSHKVTCVKGDAKDKGYLIFIRNIITKDFMTATPYDLSFDLKQKISSRILNEVKKTGRVLFDESNKPPATICYL
ncbi:MAG: glutamine-hydrolyzing GMP synthase [Candidatus Moranbacteria bacterium]|nr:glutamine-hydrolyzing GMP synthase [Candidatus Moranbacteria bacterium]